MDRKLTESLNELTEIKTNDNIAKKLIEKKLQQIIELLISKYAIKIGDITIKPIVVEAYYKNEIFDDKYTHDSPRQKNNIENIYIHEKGRGGIDLCLSDGNYALSFLIKNSVALIPKRSKIYKPYEIFFTQTQLYDFLKNDNNCGFFQCQDENKNKYYSLKKEMEIVTKEEIGNILFVRRKGLETSENIKSNNIKDKEHFDCELSGFFIESIKKYPITCEGGKENAVITYFLKEHFNLGREDVCKEAKDFLGYIPKKFDEIFDDYSKNKYI